MPVTLKYAKSVPSSPDDCKAPAGQSSDHGIVAVRCCGIVKRSIRSAENIITVLDGFRKDLKKPGIQRRALIIAAIVGTLLNCINQGVEVMHGNAVQVGKALLTYMVPYCVSVYSSIAASRNIQ